jgi:hypothetical protein
MSRGGGRVKSAIDWSSGGVRVRRRGRGTVECGAEGGVFSSQFRLRGVKGGAAAIRGGGGGGRFGSRWRFVELGLKGVRPCKGTGTVVRTRGSHATRW